jgi:type I site-specific restriction endonuclease
MKKMKKTDMPDPFVPLIHIAQGKGFSEAHNKAIALISNLLHKAGYNVNYDHIVSTTPRDLTIPLKLNLRKRGIKIDADISFFLDNKTIVFVEIKTAKISLMRR